MNRLIFPILAVTIAGCSGSFELARIKSSTTENLVGAPPAADASTSEKLAFRKRCAQLDDRKTKYSTIGMIAGSLGGVAGLSTIPVDQSDKEVRYSLLVGGAMAAAVGVGMYGWSAMTSTTYVAEGCAK